VLRGVTEFRVHALFANELPEWRSAVADGTRRCVATRRLPQQLEGLPKPKLVGSLEAWFESLDDARAWAERTNRDYAPTATLTSEEFAVFDGRRTYNDVKGKFLFRRKPGMSIAEFRAYWLDRHGPIVLRTPEILRYVQSHVLADSAGDPIYDGITEIHWADFDAAMRSMGSREMTVEQAADAAQFAAPRSVELVLLAERELT
jgi:uncharacterized protein (TIGR02118 family)